MYKHVCNVSEALRQRLLSLVDGVQWSPSKGRVRDYWAYVMGRVMFVKICPGGKVHLHSDNGYKIHIVLQGQGDSFCGQWYQLKLGGVYLMDASIPHESLNNGVEDRIHMVIS